MPATDARALLDGVTVWVTRPTHQAQAITTQLNDLGASVLALPTLAIEPLHDPASQQRLAEIEQYDVVIFISANAVQFALDQLKPRTKIRDIATIGQATAAKCRELGLDVQFVPEQADSDGLLQLTRFAAVDGQKILIVRGAGGREHLATQLRARGARVDYAEVYARHLPKSHITAANAVADIIMITSTEVLTNLVTLARRNQQNWVFDRQLLLIHERIAGRVSELGFTLKPLVASEASDKGMIDTLLQWVRSERRVK